MWPFRKPATPDFSLLKGARAYGPVKQLSTPPENVSGTWTMEQLAAEENAIPPHGWERYSIYNPEVIAALKRNGYQCESRTSSIWYDINLTFEHGKIKTLPDGTALILSGALLQMLEETRKATWGVTTQEAADALLWAFGLHEPEPIEESSNGIEPCGYEEL